MRTRRQRLGQHFLGDERVAREIAGALPAGPRVLEIGPGQGALTRQLLERHSVVRAIELDRELAGSLARRLGRPAGLEVRTGDALTDDLDQVAAQGPWLLAANLPYSVGTAILRRILPRGDLFPAAVVMLQEEVAHRLVAPPGSADRGLLSLEVELHAAAELLFSVPARCFVPPPRVRSAVVRLRLRSPAEVPSGAEPALRLAGVAFSHRRKKLPNALGSEVHPHDVARLLSGLGLDPDARPQDLAIEAWLALAAALSAPRGDAA